MFDPNQPLPDFQTQALEVKRQRDMADALRSLGKNQPQGQMVSGHYVAPSLFESLAPALTTFMGAYAGDKANTMEQASSAQAAQARQDWQNNLPVYTKSPELQGPPDINGSPELQSRMVPPDRGSVLKATIAGLNIPGNKDAALAYNKGMGEEITREDNQDARRENLQAQLAQQKWTEAERLKQRAEEARQRSEDQRLNREERERAAKEMVEWRGRHDEVLKEIAQIRADAVANGRAPKTLPQFVHKNLSELDAAANVMGNASSTFKPEYGGLTGLGKTMMGTYMPGADTDAANWWKDYRKQAQLTERHAMFGSALTASEKSAWRGADIEPYMNPQLIQENLAKRAQITEKLYERARQQYSKEGHDVSEAFPSRGYSDVRAPTASGIRKKINGKTYVQQNGQWFEE